MRGFLAAASVGLISGIVVARWLRWPNDILRLRLRVLASVARKLTLSNVRIPLALMSTSSFPSACDGEGLVLCDVEISGGKISSITTHESLTSVLPFSLTHLDLGGSVVLACWADAHTHLVKTHLHPRARNPTGTISDAVAVELDDQPRWTACACCRPHAIVGKRNVGQVTKCSATPTTPATPTIDSSEACPHADDVIRRMEFAVASAYHHGARAMRTHLDGSNSTDAKLRATVYSAFSASRARWLKKGVTLQGVANLYLPLWLDHQFARRHVDEALGYEGVLLGAYCGNVSETPPHETIGAFDVLFKFARERDVMVDLHIDETNDPRCCCLLSLIDSLTRARAAGYRRHVVLGHCCSLSLQGAAVRETVIDGLRAVGGVTVVCNPSTNMGLQDRRGSAAPHCVPIEFGVAHTPRWRGLTLLQELREASVNVGAASDNVRDWWHPYGDYDGLEVWRAAVTVGQLDTAPSEGAWADLVSDAPSNAMELPPVAGSLGSSTFQTGATADLILFPGVHRISELFSRAQSDRVVLRGGRVQLSSLPSYRLLDDLVAHPTLLQTPRESVQRGATAPKAC